MNTLTLPGKDNYGKPRQDYADRLAGMSEADFLKAAEKAIGLSAHTANNLRSDYHWQCNACYDEAIRRGNKNLYSRAHACASAR